MRAAEQPSTPAIEQPGTPAAEQPEASGPAVGSALPRKKAGSARKFPAPKRARDEFLRAPNEDDDGYDPYSDRRPDTQPLFERDPWN